MFSFITAASSPTYVVLGLDNQTNTGIQLDDIFFNLTKPNLNCRLDNKTLPHTDAF